MPVKLCSNSWRMSRSDAPQPRPVMAREIDDESAADAGRDSLVREKLHDVEQMAGMLAVHRRKQLAAIHVFERHHRDFEIRLQRVARVLCQRRHAHRMDGTAHDEVDLDLDLDSALPHQQLRLTSGSRRMGLEALPLQPSNGLADGSVDAFKRLLARRRVGGKHQVKIDREPRRARTG